MNSVQNNLYQQYNPDFKKITNTISAWLFSVYFVLSVLFFSISSSLAQTKLCEANSVLYSVCYDLQNDGSFSYRYTDCTGMTIGTGKFTRKRRKMTLKFENTSVTPIIESRLDGEMNNHVSIRVFDILHKEPEVFARILYNEKSYFTNIDGHCKLQYSGGDIKIPLSNNDTIVITPDEDKSNSYEVYRMPLGVSIVEAGRIVELIKAGKKYKLREKFMLYSDKRGFYPKRRTRCFVVKN